MLHVTCAIIEHNNKILICQRSASMKLPLKWEFPGGKIEGEESKEECLKREIKEELGLEIEVGSTLTHVEHHYPEFSLYLYPFICRWTGGSLAIAEHAQAIWVPHDDLRYYDWAEADMPVVKEIAER
ncbi:(deoxy)nucleoside triphosphate pyrophosphohydrolase [Sphingobacterium sp. DN00404]|uniref:8-oxo-dGTP diphosphatase n=1 Tax=Sphingobacterium micropteri TaxID=2763501 RepID=A0ABR7YM70_9SPHI|nr:(deoxy)nucleoside triphosphate pyrophosphohydrolase [Sphingobacterium micropteri]MBD1432321.1 (deoxy)nucleoside triphosphate pyrophosphohydrolase [Sphingobacterium micropteri]